MTQTFRIRRALLVAGMLGGPTMSLLAAPPVPQTYAVLSLIGDSFSVVTRRISTGSGLDNNEHQEFPLDSSGLDDVAVAAVQRSARASAAQTEPLRVSIRDPRLYALQERLLGDDADAQVVRSAVQGVLRAAGATRLVLVTRSRQDALFPLRSGSVAGGKLQGAGFFIDNQFRTQRVSSGERSTGFLGPYAFATLTLADVETMRVLKKENAAATSLVAPSITKDAVRPWDSLTPEQKMQALDRVVDSAVAKAAVALFID